MCFWRVGCKGAFIIKQLRKAILSFSSPTNHNHHYVHAIDCHLPHVGQSLRSSLWLKCCAHPTLNSILCFLPHACEDRRIARATDELSDNCVDVCNGTLSELGLVIARAQEMGEYDRREEGILERQRAEYYAEEYQKLGVSDDAHRGVVVR